MLDFVKANIGRLVYICFKKKISTTTRGLFVAKDVTIIMLIPLFEGTVILTHEMTCWHTL